jgi:pectinesterase
MPRSFLSAFTLLLVSALTSPLSAAAKPDAIVAADGSGQYLTVRAAIDAAPQLTHAGAGRWTIFVKAGTYREIVYIQREKRFISLVGEDAEKTVVTFDLFNDYPAADGKPIATFRTPTVILDADDFTVENLTFANTAGAKKGQALAIRVDGDRVIFRRCRFLGWQDTILLNRGRHYFEDCYIAGATDFIFGGATAYFEGCTIHAAGSGYLTAASTPDFAPYGFVFAHCKITGESPDVKTYLGRPWRDYAQTIFLFTEMSAHVRSEGWDNWKKPYAEKVSRYSEFGSTGPGASPSTRATWAKPLTETEARALTPQKVLGGTDQWNPITSVSVRPQPE